MALFIYTAQRSLVLGHAAQSKYSIEIGLQQASPSEADVRTDERSAGGALESSYERTDVTWQFATAPVRGVELAQLREFLDSTESGQVFRGYLYGNESTPIALRRIEDGHAESSFMRVGGADLDYFTASFSAIEAVSDYITDISETIDVYAPEEGGGGPGGVLDPPPVVAVVLNNRTYLVNGYESSNAPSLRMYTMATTQPFGKFVVAKNNSSFNTLLVDDALIAGEGQSFTWTSTEEWWTGESEPPDGAYEIRVTRTNEVHSESPTFNGEYATWLPLDNADYTSSGWMWDCFYFAASPSSYTADWIVEIRDASTLSVLATATWSIILNANAVPED